LGISKNQKKDKTKQTNKQTKNTSKIKSMAPWLIAEQLGYLTIDRIGRLSQAKDHISSAVKIFNFNDLLP